MRIAKPATIGTFTPYRAISRDTTATMITMIRMVIGSSGATCARRFPLLRPQDAAIGLSSTNSASGGRSSTRSGQPARVPRE